MSIANSGLSPVNLSAPGGKDFTCGEARSDGPSESSVTPVAKALPSRQYTSPQLLSYLKLSGKSLRLLINFNVVYLHDGIKRLVNGAGWN